MAFYSLLAAAGNTVNENQKSKCVLNTKNNEAK